MAFCYNCGKQLNDVSKFCSEYGVKQEVTDNTSVRKQEFIEIVKNNKIVNKSLKKIYR